MRKTAKTIIILCLVLCSIFTLPFSAYADENGLVYSVHVYTPPNFQNFNCYGYAINTIQNVNPGYYSGRSMTQTHTGVRDNVLYDLISLGCSNVRTVSSSYTLQSEEVMIALCTGTMMQISNSSLFSSTICRSEGFNYHFFRKETSGGSWYHKYGTQSGIMRLLSTPSSTTVTDECYNSITGVLNPASHIMMQKQTSYIVFRPSQTLAEQEQKLS